MKVVLINPPEMIAGEEDGAGFGARSFVKQLRVLPPLGLAYLAAALERAGHDVELIDANALRLDPDETVKMAAASAPDAIGITCVTPLFPVVAYIGRSLKQALPDVPIIVGGPQVTIMPELTMENPAFDYGVEGEAEIALPQILEAISGRVPPVDVGGALYRRDGQVVLGGPAEVTPIDEIPLPARDRLPNDRYFDMTTESRRVSSIMTARGCPYKCAFCERYIRGGHYRMRSAESVVDELELLITKYGCTEVVIYDDTFTANKNRAAEICESILRRGLKFKWDCRTRVDCVSPDLLRLMARAGCSRISFGVESASEDVRETFNKGITIDQVSETFEWTRAAGIRILAYFMLGAPKETRASIGKTLALSLKLNPDFAYYSIVVPYPGTDLYDDALKEGLIGFDYWKKYVRTEGALAEPVPMFEHGDVTRKRLLTTLKRSYLRFYLRPTYIARRLTTIRSLSDLLWHIKMFKATLR